MSTAAGTGQVIDLGHDVINMAKKLELHVSHLTNDPRRQIKVRINREIKNSTYIELKGTRFRLTMYGIVAKQHRWQIRAVTPLSCSILAELSPAVLSSIRRILVALINSCSDKTFGHPV